MESVTELFQIQSTSQSQLQAMKKILKGMCWNLKVIIIRSLNGLLILWNYTLNLFSCDSLWTEGILEISKDI